MATKTTYKVGDKVRILGTENIFLGEEIKIVGGYAEVESVSNEGYPRLACRDGAPLINTKSELKYIEKIEESDAKMTQFKVGDKVRVIADEGDIAGVKIGTIATVTEVDSDGDVRLDVNNKNGVPAFFLAREVELVSQKLTKNQRISSLEQAVEALQAEVESLKAAQKPPVTVIADAIQRYNERTPNEQRKAIIDEAKAFVEATLAEVDEQMGWQTTKIRTYKEHGRLRIEFIVNTEKRTVVALARYGNMTELPDVIAKGIAKCNPSDVFNADIGKAIALGRALGLDVKRFEKAVQPGEVVVGHIFDTTPGGGNWTATVTKLGDSRAHDLYGKAFQHSHDSGWLGEKQVKVIDDSEAQY